jgi:hypothetical protein
MWQVYLYLANEHQGRERDARAAHRRRRWPFGRRDRHDIARATGAARRVAVASDRVS